jgi:hypothetical protein
VLLVHEIVNFLGVSDVSSQQISYVRVCDWREKILIVGWDRSDRFLDTLSPFIVEIIDIAHAILLVNEARIPQNIRHADNLVGWNQVIFLNML